MTSGYINLDRYNIDGTNFFESSLAFKQAIERARKGKGPSVIVSNVVRLIPHSSSDEQKKYRTEKSLKIDKKKDPIRILENQCLENNIADKDEFQRIKETIEIQIENYKILSKSEILPLPVNSDIEYGE